MITLLALLIIIASIIIASAAMLRRMPFAKPASKTPAFGREVIVDHEMPMYR